MMHRLLLVVALLVGCGEGRARELKYFDVHDAIPPARPAAPSAEKRARLPRAGLHH